MEIAYNKIAELKDPAEPSGDLAELEKIWNAKRPRARKRKSDTEQDKN